MNSKPNSLIKMTQRELNNITNCVNETSENIQTMKLFSPIHSCKSSFLAQKGLEDDYAPFEFGMNPNTFDHNKSAGADDNDNTKVCFHF